MGFHRIFKYSNKKYEARDCTLAGLLPLEDGQSSKGVAAVAGDFRDHQIG